MNTPDNEPDSLTAKAEYTQEDWQRDLERRKMLVIIGFVTWNMFFYVFVLLPLVKIYQFGNPYWLAITNGLFSICVGILVFKKQKLLKEELTKEKEANLNLDNT